MTGLISGLNLKATLIGDESLSQRPMSRVVNPLVKWVKKFQQMMVKLNKIKGGSINDNFEYKCQCKCSSKIFLNFSITIIRKFHK